MAIALTGLAAMVLGWLRATTGAIWPAFLARCAPELAMSAGTAVVAAVHG